MRPMPPETTARARSDAALGSFTIWLIQRAHSGGDVGSGLNITLKSSFLYFSKQFSNLPLARRRVGVSELGPGAPLDLCDAAEGVEEVLPAEVAPPPRHRVVGRAPLQAHRAEEAARQEADPRPGAARARHGGDVEHALRRIDRSRLSGNNYTKCGLFWTG